MSIDKEHSGCTAKAFDYLVGCAQVIGTVIGIIALIISFIGFVWAIRNQEAAIQIVRVVSGDATSTPVIIVLPTGTPLPTYTPQPGFTSLPTYTPRPTYTPFPTHTPYPTFTPYIIATQTPPTFTSTPIPENQDPPPGSTISAGSSYSYRGIAVSTHPEVRVYGDRVQVRLIVRNNRDQPYILRFTGNIFHLRDDTGKRYPLKFWSSSLEREQQQESLNPNDEHIIEFDFSGYVGATNLGYFQGPIPVNAQYLVFTVDELAGMTNLNWQYNLQ